MIVRRVVNSVIIVLGDTIMKKKNISRQKKVNEAIEELDAIGHENEKEGIKWTQYFMKQWDLKQWEKNQFKEESLKKKRRDRLGYHRVIAGMLGEEALGMDIPLGYQVGAFFSGDGVILKLVDRWGKKYHRAFKPDGVPKIDFNAVVGLLVDLQNTIDLLEFRAQQELPQNSGIILK